MRECSSFRVDTGDNVELNCWHWPAVDEAAAEGQGPVLFLHATGFHGRVWNQVIEQLPGREVYALDSPGHGLSDNIEPPFTWQHFADRTKTFLEKTGLENITGVGHSMGGHLLVLLAAELDVFERLVLLDPIILPLEGARMASRLEEMGIEEHPTARRRNEWASPDEMYESFVKREPFSGWQPEVVRDYCQWGLLKTGDHYELACPPNIESAIYLSSGGEQVYEAIPKVKVPVQIVRGRPRQEGDSPLDFRPSPTNPELEHEFADATDEQLMDYSHFFPFENPALVAGLLKK